MENTITAPKKGAKVKGKVEILEITAVKRKPSMYAVEGNVDRNGNQIYIDVAGRTKLLVVDRIVLPFDVWVDKANQIHSWIDDGSENMPKEVREEKAYNAVVGYAGDIVEIRWIKGSPIVWKSEQERRNVKPTKDDYLYLKAGTYSVANEGLYTGQFKFLSITNQNASNEYRDASISRPSFKVVDHRKDAIEILERLDIRKEADALISSLRNRNTKTYDVTRLNFYASIFKLGGFASDDEKYLALVRLAEDNPNEIIKKISGTTGEYLAVIHSAFDLGLLQIEGAAVYDKEKHLIVKGDKKISRIGADDLLVPYYSSNEGATDFQSLKSEVELKEKEKQN